MGALIVNSLVSLGYYLPLIGRLLKRVNPSQERIRVSLWMLAPAVALAVLVVAFGVFPQPTLGLTREAARFLLDWGRLR